jgi:membrane protein implicated in regulation of membrane protease activity
VFALGAAVAAVLTLLLALLFVLFAIGPVAVVATLVVVGDLSTMLAVAGFVYLRPDIPSSVRRKIEAARERSDDTRRKSASMSEQEAIDELKRQYVEGTLTEPEL